MQFKRWFWVRSCKGNVRATATDELVKRTLNKSYQGRGSSLHPTSTSLMSVPAIDAQSLENGSQASRKAPKEQHEGIPATAASRLAWLGAQPKCLYANAGSKGNKQKELRDVCMPAGRWSYWHHRDWRDGSYNWSVEKKVLGFLERTGKGGQGGLHINDQLESKARDKPVDGWGDDQKLMGQD